MPWTLYRYISLELLKVLVLTTVILVTVMSMVAAVKPVADGLLSAVSAIQFVLYTAPTMIAFALPFAGAFAATIVFIRMAADNEVLACSASGMSYRSLLLPVLTIGIVLTMGLFLMSNFVIPHFYQQARQTVEADVITLLVHQLNRNEPFEGFDDAVLYADAAERRAAPQFDGLAIQPAEWIVLSGVAVGELDDAGALRREVTAETANILLFRDGGRSWITMRLRDLMYYDPERQELASATYYDPPFLMLPDPLRHNPKFFSYLELRDLSLHPDRYDRVRESQHQLARRLAAERFRHELIAALDEDAVTLRGISPQHQYTLSAPTIERAGDRLTLRASDDEPVTVRSNSPDRPQRRFESQLAHLEVDQPEAAVNPALRVELEQVRVVDADQPQRFTEHARRTLPRLHWPAAMLPENPSLSFLVSLADQQPYADNAGIQSAVDRVAMQVRRLAHRITGQLHDRAASALACLLLMVLGAVLSMHFKHHPPLLVYFWSFLLAIMTLLLIYAGERTARSHEMPIFIGLSILWSGNLLLAIVIGTFYCRLARN